MKHLTTLCMLLLLWIPLKVSAQHHLIVLNKSDNTAWQLNAQTGEKIAEYNTGIGPHEVAISPDSRWAVITNYGDSQPGNSLSLIDLKNRSLTKTIDLDTLERPHGVAWFSDGRRVIVTVEASEAVAVVDVEKESVLAVTKTDEEVSHMVELDNDEKHAYVPNLGSGTVSVLSLEEGKKIKSIPTGNGTEGITLANNGKEIWATNRGSDTITIINTETLEITDTLNSNSFPIRAESSPNGKYIAVSNAQSSDITIFDASSREVIETVSTLTPGVGNGIPIGLTFSGDSGRLYVSNSNANQILVIDTYSWKLMETFQTGDTPDGIAFFTLNN